MSSTHALLTYLLCRVKLSGNNTCNLDAVKSISSAKLAPKYLHCKATNKINNHSAHNYTQKKQRFRWDETMLIVVMYLWLERENWWQGIGKSGIVKRGRQLKMCQTWTPFFLFVSSFVLLFIEVVFFFLHVHGTRVWLWHVRVRLG